MSRNHLFCTWDTRILEEVGSALFALCGAGICLERSLSDRIGGILGLMLETRTCAFSVSQSTGEDGASVDVVPAPFDGAEQRGIYEVRGPGRHVTAQAA